MSSTNGRTLSLEQAAREQETIEALLAADASSGRRCEIL